MSTESTHTVVKLAIVGDGGVGKSTLISRLTTGEYIESKMTIGFDMESWTITTNENGEAIKVACFDFGGQPQFRFFQGSLILGAKVALIVFDCSSYRSLEKIREWMDLLAGVPNSKKLLVGTKLDVGSCIADEDIQQIADDLGIDYILISSKTGENFPQLVDQLQVMVGEL
jgi:small GTP-binding protein